MKSLTWLIAMAVAMVLTMPAAAQTLYSNGPINGNSDGWTINLSFVVSDTFTISGGGANVTGLSFGAWLNPGDTLTSAEVQITSLENGGTTYFDQVVDFNQSDCVANQFGYQICRETGSFNAGNLGNGTYWLNLQNAEIPSGDPVYWDQNSGASSASDSPQGTIASESFTILGSNTTSTSTSVPEPSSLVLVATGCLGLAAAVRRKLG